MRIDGLKDNTINVEAAYNVGFQNREASGIAEIFSQDAGVMTMNSTNGPGKGMLGMLVQDGTFESVKENAEIIKNTLSVMFDKMDTGEVVKMDEDGIDINNTEVDKIVTVVEEIQIKLAMYCDDFSLVGTNVDMDDIKATMGSAAATYKAAAAMSDSAKAYLVKNELEPTVENVYVAMHSGMPEKGRPLTDSQWEELTPQVNKVIEEAGIEVNDESHNRCRYMVENDIDLTVENLQYFTELDGLEVPTDEEVADRIKATMLEGREPVKTKVTGEALPWEETVSAMLVIGSAMPEHIMTFVRAEVHNLDTLADIENKDVKTEPDYEDRSYISMYRQMQEIRLMMTLDAGRVLENNGISINTVEISELVDRLKEYEAERLSEVTSGTGNKTSIEEVTEVNEILLAMEELKRIPSAVIGKTLDVDVRSAEVFMSYAPEMVRKFSAAGEAYDALCTEVRQDLGDRITTAIKASTGDILEGMGYENNDANRRAIRILAYNEMAFTPENVDAVKAIDSSVNTLFDNMTPEKTLKMIRDGVNPLETDIDELNRYINNLEGNEHQIEKYSEFLYKLEKNNEITAGEREKYIALYSLINKFETEGMNSIGQLVNQGLEINMGNLLTAYMSRHDRGMDLKADDSIGVKNITDKVTYYKNLFAGIKNKVMPEVLNQIPDMEMQNPEAFAENIMNSTGYEADDRILEDISELPKIELSLFKVMAEYQVPVTINNIKAMKTLTDKPEDIFENVEDDEITSLLDDREELLSAYDRLATKAKENLTAQMYSEVTTLDISSMKMISTGMNIVSHMAKRNNYYIPCNEGNERVIINLKIVEGKEESGKFQISFENEKYGKVSIEGKITLTTINVQMLSDSVEGIGRLNELTGNLKNSLGKAGFEDVKITGNRSEEIPVMHATTRENISTAQIFKVTKIFIAELTN